MRIVRDMGDVSAVLPEGVSSLADAPYTFFDNVRTGLMFLKLTELEEEDQPPRSIWLDKAKMVEWFESVKARHAARYSGDSDPIVREPEGDVVQNEATRHLIVE